jgi:hypothetical protein
MRSFKNIFLLLLIFIPATAYIGKDHQPSVGLSPGSTAPEIQLNNTGKELLSSSRGHLVLLQFWAAFDAESRMNNLLMYNTISRHHAKQVQMVSFSFDTQKLIFDETVRTDGISTSSQFFVDEGQNSQVYKNYHLSNGYANYLIDTAGVILAKDLTVSQLANYLK